MPASEELTPADLRDYGSPEVLAVADELAQGLVASAAPLRFDVAGTAAARQAVYRLRYRVVIARGWASPEDLPDGMERDAFDERAIHITGWAGETLVATARILLPAPGIGLPTEQVFGLEVEPRGHVADMGRQIVSAEYTSPQHRIFAALLAKTWLEIRAAGFTLICGDFSPAMLRLYRVLGFEVRQLGPARQFFGEERYPILVDVGRSVSKLVERWNKGNAGPPQQKP